MLEKEDQTTSSGSELDEAFLDVDFPYDVKEREISDEKFADQDFSDEELPFK